MRLIVSMFYSLFCPELARRISISIFHRYRTAADDMRVGVGATILPRSFEQRQAESCDNASLEIGKLHAIPILICGAVIARGSRDREGALGCERLGRSQDRLAGRTPTRRRIIAAQTLEHFGEPTSTMPATTGHPSLRKGTLGLRVTVRGAETVSVAAAASE